MKTAKLVLGILSIVLSILVLFQACAATVGDALAAEGGTSGASGTITALLLLAGGIIDVAGRRSKGAAIAGTIVLFIGTLVAYSAVGVFGDLAIWGTWCLIVAAVNAISIFTQDYEKTKSKK